MEKYGEVWRSMELIFERFLKKYGVFSKSMEKYGEVWRSMEKYGVFSSGHPNQLGYGGKASKRRG